MDKTSSPTYGRYPSQYHVSPEESLGPPSDSTYTGNTYPPVVEGHSPLSWRNGQKGARGYGTGSSHNPYNTVMECTSLPLDGYLDKEQIPHWSHEIPTPPETVPCPVTTCHFWYEYKAGWEANLEYHYRVHHPGETCHLDRVNKPDKPNKPEWQTVPGEAQVHCRWSGCRNVGFGSESDLKSHILGHYPEVGSVPPRRPIVIPSFRCHWGECEKYRHSVAAGDFRNHLENHWKEECARFPSQSYPIY